MTTEIRLLVNKQGKLLVEMAGYSGDACGPVLDRLLKALAAQGIRPTVERIERIGEAPQVEDARRVVEP